MRRKRKEYGRRLLSMVLVLLMLCSVLPAESLAAEEVQEATAETVIAAQEEPSMEAETPKEEKETAKEETPKEEKETAKAETPKEEKQTAKEEAPKEEKQTAKEEAPKEEKQTDKEEAPTKEEQPVKENMPADEEALSGTEALSEKSQASAEPAKEAASAEDDQSDVEETACEPAAEAASDDTGINEENVSVFGIDYTDDLTKCLTGLKLFHKLSDGSWVEVKAGDVVNISDTYRFELAFAEKPDSLQFLSTAYYTFPNTIQLVNAAAGSFVDKDQNVNGTYSIDPATGKVTVNFAQTGTTFWNDNENNCTMTLKFETTFKGTQDDKQHLIDLGNSTTIVVSLKVNATLDADKSLVDYDEKTRIARYKVTAKADGNVNSVILRDEYSKYMILDTGSVSVGTKKVAPSDIRTGGSDPKTFEIDLGTIGSGQTVDVTYSMKIDDKAFGNDAKNTLYLENKATFAGTDGTKPISDSADAHFTATQINMNKDGDVDSKNNVINWTITLGDGYPGTDVSGTVKDSLPTGLTLDGSITVKYTIGSTETTTTASKLDAIVIPAGAYYAKISYKTKYDPSNIAIGGTKYKNDASHDKKWKVSKEVTVDGLEPKIDKSRTKADKDSITYEVTLTVPAGMDSAPCFYLYDKLEIKADKTYAAVNNATVKSITADGNPLSGWTKVTDAKEPQGFYIFFGGGTTAATSKWGLSTASKVVITYELDLKGNVLDNTGASLGKTINDLLDGNGTLKNTAAVYYAQSVCKEDGDEYYRSDTYMNKRVVNVDSGNGLIDYEVEFKPCFAKDSEVFTFKDSFDPRLQYVAGSLYVEKISTSKGQKVTETYYYNGKPQDTTQHDSKTPGVISFESHKFFPAGGGSHMTRYGNNKDNIFVVHYQLQVGTGVDLSKNSSFTNTAWVYDYTSGDVICQDVCVLGYPSSILNKKAVQKAQNGDIVIYTIDVNKDAQKLSNTGSITLKDTQNGKLLSLQPGTIQVKKEKDDGSGGWIPLTGYYTIYGGGTEIVFTLPDQVHIEITYEMKVISDGDVSVTNQVKITGYEQYTVDSVRRFAVTQSAATSGSGHGSFTLYKYDKDTNAPLAGAVFKLYSTTANTNSGDYYDDGTTRYYCAADSAGNSVTFTTGALGYVTIDHAALTLDQSKLYTYVLIEESAPNNYKLDKTPVYFTFQPASSFTIPAGISLVYNGGNLSVYNEKKPVEKGHLKITKTISGDVTEAEAEKSIVFTVTDPAGNNTDYNLTAFTHTPGTSDYVLTLSNVVTGNYTVKEKAYTITGKTVSVTYTIGTGTAVAGDSAALTVTKNSTAVISFENKYTDPNGGLTLTNISNTPSPSQPAPPTTPPPATPPTVDTTAGANTGTAADIPVAEESDPADSPVSNTAKTPSTSKTKTSGTSRTSGESKKTTSPSTGDSNNPGFFMALMAGSALGLVLAGASARRRRRKYAAHR